MTDPIVPSNTMGEALINAGVDKVLGSKVVKAGQIPKLGINDTEISLLENSGSIGVINTKTGSISTRKRVGILDAARPGVLSSVDHLTTAQSFITMRLANGKPSFALPFGVTLLNGPTAAGKSSLLRQLGFQRFRTIETHDSMAELSSSMAFESFDHALLAAASSSIRSKDVIAIDSLRGPLFTANGAAGPKGIIMSFFISITQVSMSLAARGITMIMSVNPLHGDPEYVAEFNSMLSSAVPAIITLDSLTPNSTNFSGIVQDRTARRGIGFTIPIDRTVMNSKTASGSSSYVTRTNVAFAPPPSTKDVSPISNMQAGVLAEID